MEIKIADLKNTEIKKKETTIRTFKDTSSKSGYFAVFFFTIPSLQKILSILPGFEVNRLSRFGAKTKDVTTICENAKILKHISRHEIQVYPIASRRRFTIFSFQ